MLWLPCASARVGGRSGARTQGLKRNYNRNIDINYHLSARHTHFSYHPPKYVNYMCRYCAAPVAYPVYHAPLPSYVFKYRESRSRYGDLLTGLALYNLGRASSYDTPYNTYYHKQSVAEECSMQVVDHLRFEEIPVPCFMISTFLERAAAEPAGPQLNQLDITSPQIDVHNFINATGEPLDVTSEQECIIWHNSTMSKERSKVPCALLKRYAETLRPSGVPVYVWLPVLLATCVAITICCQCCCRKKVDRKEEAPLNETTVLGYSSYMP